MQERRGQWVQEWRQYRRGGARHRRGLPRRVRGLLGLGPSCPCLLTEDTTSQSCNGKAGYVR